MDFIKTFIVTDLRHYHVSVKEKRTVPHTYKEPIEDHFVRFPGMCNNNLTFSWE